MAQGKPQLNLKEIDAISSEIIDAIDGWTDNGRRMDGRTTDEWRFHELC